jgi:hypothetical protein
MNSSKNYLWGEIPSYHDQSLEIQNIKVENSGFESGSANWLMSKDYKIISNGGRNGTAALFCERETIEETEAVCREFKLQHNCYYKMACWIKADITALGEYKTGATFIMLFKKGDRVLHRIYPNGLIKSGDWTYIEKVFTMVPDADTCEIKMNLFNGYRGRAWFDSLSLEIYDKWSIYVAAPGMRTIFMDCPEMKVTAYCTGDKSDENLYCLAEVCGENFKEKTVAKIVNGQASIVFNQLHPGQAKVDLILLDAQKKQILARESFETNIFVPEQRNKDNACWIDLKGRSIVDGKPFLPIGLFMGHCLKEDIDIIADSDFNCLMPYASMSLRSDYKYEGDEIDHYTDRYDGDANNSIDKVKEVLDLCNDKGLKIVFNLINLYEEKKFNIKKWHGVKGTDNIVKKVIQEFKDNPSILAWYVNDESPASMFDTLYARRKLLNQLDPYHPTWCVSMHFTELYTFTQTCDVMGIDPYPLINKNSDMGPLKFAGQQAAKLKMPYWGVPQIFSWAYYEPFEDIGKLENWTDVFPVPTEEEIRTMTLSMAINGAKGFLFYYYPCIKDEGNHIPVKDYFVKNWAKVKSVASALKSLESYLLSDHEQQPIKLADVKGSVNASEFINNEGKSCVIIAAGKLEKSSCIINSNKKYKSQFGNTKISKDGKYLFEGQNISSDILFEQ